MNKQPLRLGTGGRGFRIGDWGIIRGDVEQ